MGGKDSDTFKRFVDLACKAFNILRKNAATFINLCINNSILTKY